MISNPRMFDYASVINVADTSQPFINYGTTPLDGIYSNENEYTVNSKAARCDDDQVWNGNVNIRLDGVFTIAMWLKFLSGTATTNRVYIRFADFSEHTSTISSTIDLTQWNYFRISRDSNDLISIYFGNNLVDSFTSSAPLYFGPATDVCIFVGNTTPGTVGYTPIIDDVFFTDEVITEIPTTYKTAHRILSSEPPIPGPDDPVVGVNTNILRIY